MIEQLIEQRARLWALMEGASPIVVRNLECASAYLTSAIEAQKMVEGLKEG